MKKSFPANINGKIFYIDEDAYTLLLDYLSQLRATFADNEADEIVNDIEQRISEHFEERIARGANVIVIDDVNRVIETMGRPEELSEEDPDSTSRHSSEPTGATPPDPKAAPQSRHSTGQSTPPPPPIHKRLYRDVRHKVFGGVIAGLAQYLGWDVTVMRILATILTVCTYFWPCVIVYMVAWMIIPVAHTPRQILEMQGQPVTLDNIGQTVINNSTPPAAPVPDENSSSFATFINTFFSIAAKFILGFFGMVCAIVAFVMLCLILSLVAGIIVYSVTGNPNILDGLDIFSENSPVTTAWAFICLFFSIMLPFILIARYAAVPLLRFKVPSAATLITAIIIELLFITATVVLYNIAYNFDSAGTVFAVVQTTGSLGADPIHSLLPFAAAIPASMLLAPSISA